MGQRTSDPVDTELARGFTIRDYERARDSQPPDRTAIAEAIHHRFMERYIAPVSGPPRHGFTIMAVSCLMIEALESFRQGWEHTDRRSRDAFCLFFSGVEPFRVLESYAGTFYDNVRCGILHQAETTDGWRIRRDSSPLLDPVARTINAEQFLEALRQVLQEFCDHLKQANWNGPEWTNVRKKMDAIIRNCNRP